MIKTVVFDFDGTLVLSNGIKRDGFFAIADGFPGGAAAMTAILAKPPGDRFAICAAFAAAYGANGAALAERYSIWCEERILVCPERSGAAAILARLRRSGLKLYVNSATPEAFLRRVVERRYAPGTFDGVLGGHGAKVANLTAVVAREGIAPTEMLMVGDGTDDRDAATEIGCPFVGVAAGTLEAAGGAGPLIHDLGELAFELEEATR